MLTFDKLWATMENRGVSTYTLRENFMIDTRTLRRLKKNMNTETKTIDRLCEILNCEVSDIVEYKPDNKIE